MKKNIKNIKSAVCIMANKLRKRGFSLSEAFKKAWKRIKQTMTFRVVGTSYENRQERLQWLKRFSNKDLSVSLHREKDNAFDSNAIGVVVHIKPINRYTLIGYVPRGLAAELSAVLDSGVNVTSNLVDIIGGYGHKEAYGLLMNVSI